MDTPPSDRNHSNLFKRFRWLRASIESGDISLDELHRFIDQCLIAEDEIGRCIAMAGDILRRQGGRSE